MIRGILLILALATALAYVTNAVSPYGLQWHRASEGKDSEEKKSPAEFLATVDDAKDMLSRLDSVFIDMRPQADFQAAHIAGAISQPPEKGDKSLGDIQALLTAETPILLYCNATPCEEAYHLARALQSQGYPNVRILVGGFVSWQAAGLATE